MSGKRQKYEVSEEDIWEAFMGLGNNKSENKYQVLTDHIEESKPINEVQVYKEPETYYEYVSNKFYDAYKYVTCFFR